MAGTDHGAAAELGQAGPVFVLVRPQMGENIGAAARAMWNFGLDRMRLVDPRDGWPNPKAVALASGAARVLDHLQVAGTTAEAVGDCDYLFATTARNRELTKTVVTPERAMAEARARIAEGQKVGVLFGPERAGLENDDVARAQAIVSVPVNPAFASLNLGQSVLLMAYEWQRQVTDMAPEMLALAKTQLAQGIEVEKLGDHFEEKLDQAGFFWPADKGPSMKMNLRNLLGRMPLTSTDVQIFHGILRQLTRTKPPKGGAG